MNGFEATRAIKEGLPETKDLIMSATHFSRLEVERWGAEGYVSKIAPVDEQLEAIREALR